MYKRIFVLISIRLHNFLKTPIDLFSFAVTCSVFKRNVKFLSIMIPKYFILFDANTVSPLSLILTKSLHPKEIVKHFFAFIAIRLRHSHFDTESKT